VLSEQCRVQWDTSTHDWLEGRGETVYLLHMIGDASSELTALFVRHDSTEENMRVRRLYLERHGRPVAFYADQASLFQTAPKNRLAGPARPAGSAADADRSRLAGAADRVDSGAQSAGEGLRFLLHLMRTATMFSIRRRRLALEKGTFSFCLDIGWSAALQYSNAWATIHFICELEHP
jgi:hypothetical protein